MPPLSVSIVCRNNVATLPGVLDAVAPLVAADPNAEIVALDSGSTDGTIELLESRRVRVLREPWRGFVKTKQQALDACVNPWILCLDSDEPPQPDLVHSIRGVLAKDDPSVQGYRVNRKAFFAGRYLDHCWQPERRLRLVRRGAARWTGIDPHDRLEMIDPAARVRDLAGVLRHDSFRSMSEHLERQLRYARLTAEGLYLAGERGGAMQVCVMPAAAFLKQMVFKSAWRDGWRGVVAAASTAAATLMKHVLLYERTSLEREQGSRERERQTGKAPGRTQQAAPEGAGSSKTSPDGA